DWLGQILRAEKQALLPDRFRIDPSGDWGGNYGPVVSRSLPLRLAAVLSGSADGPAAQNFAVAEIASASPYPDFPDDVYQSVYQPREWERFFFDDPARPSTELQLPPYYSGFGPAYPQAGETNG